MFVCFAYLSYIQYTLVTCRKFMFSQGSNEDEEDPTTSTQILNKNKLWMLFNLSNDESLLS